MTQPAIASVGRDRAAVVQELRRLLPRTSELRTAFAFGLPALDSCLSDGGLPCGALHEIVPAPHATSAALGFIAALLAHVVSLSPGGKFFFVLPSYGFRDHGRLYGHGLRVLGLDPARLILVETARRNDTLWAIEEALRSEAPAAVVGLIDKLDLKISQRLHLAAVDCGLPLFLLRPAHNLESSAAATRWRIGTAAAARDRFGLVTRSRWHVSLERCRNGRPGEWIVEYDHVAHRFSLAAALADSAHARRASPTSEAARGKVHCA